MTLQLAWMEDLSDRNLLVVLDVLEDVRDELETGAEEPQVRILPAAVRFPQLFPADTPGNRDHYGRQRWLIAEMLRQRGVLLRVNVVGAGDRWQQRIAFRAELSNVNSALAAASRESQRRPTLRHALGVVLPGFIPVWARSRRLMTALILLAIVVTAALLLERRVYQERFLYSTFHFEGRLSNNAVLDGILYVPHNIVVGRTTPIRIMLSVIPIQRQNWQLAATITSPQGYTLPELSDAVALQTASYSYLLFEATLRANAPGLIQIEPQVLALNVSLLHQEPERLILPTFDAADAEERQRPLITDPLNDVFGLITAAGTLGLLHLARRELHDRSARALPPPSL